MAEVRLRFSERGLARATKRLERLLERLGDADEVMQDAAQYMVRSTRYRLYQSKTAPDGTVWAELAEETQATRARMGYSPDNILVMTGELARSVAIDDVSDTGFIVTADADHASHHQYGFTRAERRSSGKRQRKSRASGGSKAVPARPFMGFSETNIRTIARMVNSFIAEGEGADE